jgi:hypothetical protein
MKIFKTCFGKDEEWLQQPHSCRMESLPADCSASQLRSMLDSTKKKCGSSPCLQAVVIQQDVYHPHWNEIKKYYNQGGYVVYWGVYGEGGAPERISHELGGGMDWIYSAYDRHDYILTDDGLATLGNAITRQHYSKSSLLSVLEQDRLLVPEALSLRNYVQQQSAVRPVPYPQSISSINRTHVGVHPEDDHRRGGEYFEQQVKRALESGSYESYRQEMQNQCPLALHRDANHGGRFAYIGFVNGRGNIPHIVRALISGSHTIKQQ